MTGLSSPRQRLDASHPSPVALAQRGLLNDTHAALISANRRHLIANIASWCVTALAVAYAGHIGAQSKIEPFVIAVDGVGAPRAIGPAAASKLHDPLVVSNELENWVKALRQVTSDSHQQQEWVAYMQALLEEHSQAFGVLSDWYKVQNPYTRARTEVVSVEIVGKPTQVTEDRLIETWLIGWIEDVRSPTGTLKSHTLHNASITLVYTQPSILNPAGLLVREIHW